MCGPLTNEEIGRADFNKGFLDEIEYLHGLTTLSPYKLADRAPEVLKHLSSPEYLERNARSRKLYPRAKRISFGIGSHDFGGASQLTLALRASCRRFSNNAVDRDQVAAVLVPALSRSRRVPVNAGVVMSLGSYPSAGGLFPIENYLAVMSVNGLDPGAYYFDPIDNSLSQLPNVERSKIIKGLNVSTEGCDKFSFAVISTALIERSLDKYGPRGYRFAILEAGHASQNLHMCAASIGLGSLCWGGVFEEELQSALRLDATREWVVQASLFGWPETSGTSGKVMQQVEA